MERRVTKLTYHQRAREKYRKMHGFLPRGLVVHHIDGDFTNNDIENLQAMTKKEHAWIHLSNESKRRGLMKYSNLFRRLTTNWRLAQNPPLTVNAFAEQIGCTAQWVSKLGASDGIKPSAELAFKIELLTKGEIKMIDLLISPERQKIITDEMESYGKAA